MSLKKKIILGFLISSLIIAILIISGYINFIEIKKEIQYLELSDTLRSKTLQLRRHEKNFFLYGKQEESEDVHRYVSELKSILIEGISTYNTDTLRELSTGIYEYEQSFNRIEAIGSKLLKEFDTLKPSISQYSGFFRIIESSFLERPLAISDIFTSVFLLKESTPAVGILRNLNAEISTLRKSGEQILALSKALDKSARQNVEQYIGILEIAALFLFPISLFVGLGVSFVISQNIVKRLKILIRAIQKAGTGDFSFLVMPSGRDEVGVLFDAFIKMEKDLALRDIELKKKNEELLQTKKLAAIGTLASGVAHELNNPLNNIYTSAQRLLKKTGDECPPAVQNGLNDIFTQTMRVKRIVEDLLEFARGREPRLKEVDLKALIEGVYDRLGNTIDTSKVQFELDASPDIVMAEVDPGQIEQVFNNIFANAVEAMSGEGTLEVDIQSLHNNTTVVISDSGEGIAAHEPQKIFEPFYTTKDKGTGLGLAIVFNILQKHNSEIRVANEPGRGAVFTITIPRRKE